MRERRPGGSIVRELTGHLAQPKLETRRPEITWQDYAACKDMDTNMFFPEKNQRGLAKKAKRICQGCLVKSQCLNEAFENGEEYGVWGGMTAIEREAA